MIVCNATPLISFARIGELDLLRRVVAEELVIPSAVAQEIEVYQGNRPATIDLERQSWIRRLRVTDERQVRLLLPTLDRGEAEVIALAMEHQARLVLLDELIGRKVAESLGLSVTGSAGILVRAKQLSEIPAVKPLLERCCNRASISAGNSSTWSCARSARLDVEPRPAMNCRAVLMPGGAPIRRRVHPIRRDRCRPSDSPIRRR